MKSAVALFFGLATQWNWVGAGLGGVIRVGLDYNAVPVTADLLSIPMTTDVFSDIRTLELAALDAWNRKKR